MKLNSVFLIGHLGEDPKSGDLGFKTVCNFSLATNDKWTDKEGNKQEKTEWHRIVAWGATADFAIKFLKKGSQVFVEGSLQTRKWKDQQGSDRYTTEVKTRNIEFVGDNTDNAGDIQNSFEGL